jgi:hypothetical protein
MAPVLSRAIAPVLSRAIAPAIAPPFSEVSHCVARFAAVRKPAPPAVVTLRMSRSLRDALRSAAATEGCSLNGYAVQVLAAAAGDPACFRAEAFDARDETHDHEPGFGRDRKRDEDGVPLRPRARSEHLAARQAFFHAMAAETDAVTADRLVRQRDADDPGFFVEWLRRIRREHH